jgi:hypothetical protein
LREPLSFLKFFEKESFVVNLKNVIEKSFLKLYLGFERTIVLSEIVWEGDFNNSFEKCYWVIFSETIFRFWENDCLSEIIWEGDFNNSLEKCYWIIFSEVIFRFWENDCLSEIIWEGDFNNSFEKCYYCNLFWSYI